MGQGIMQVSTGVLYELMEVTDISDVDLQALKTRLLLPEQYQIDELRQSTLAKHNGFVYVLLSAPEIPDGATVTPYYTTTFLEGRSDPVLNRIEIEPSVGDGSSD